MSDLVPALIAAGISPPVALRVANAVQAVAKPTATTSPNVVNNTYNTYASLSATSSTNLVTNDPVFSGAVNIDGDVNWKGVPVSPSPVSAVGGFGIVNGDLHFQPQQMAALADYGLGKPQRVVFVAQPGSTAPCLSSATVSVSQTGLYVPNACTFNSDPVSITFTTAAIGSLTTARTFALVTGTTLQLTPGSITIPTGYTFNPDTCSVAVSGTTTINFIQSATWSPVTFPVVTDVNVGPAGTSTKSLLQGGTCTLSGETTQVLTGASLTSGTTSVWNGTFATVIAQAITDPA